MRKSEVMGFFRNEQSRGIQKYTEYIECKVHSQSSPPSLAQRREACATVLPDCILGSFKQGSETERLLFRNINNHTRHIIRSSLCYFLHFKTRAIYLFVKQTYREKETFHPWVHSQMAAVDRTEPVDIRDCKFLTDLSHEQQGPLCVTFPGAST